MSDPKVLMSLKKRYEKPVLLQAMLLNDFPFALTIRHSWNNWIIAELNPGSLLCEKRNDSCCILNLEVEDSKCRYSRMCNFNLCLCWWCFQNLELFPEHKTVSSTLLWCGWSLFLRLVCFFGLLLNWATRHDLGFVLSEY